MKKYEEIKNLSFSGSLIGISEKTMSIHYEKLYKGYVAKWKEINDKLSTISKDNANATYSEIRALKLEESFTMNAIILHENYFDILGGNGEALGNIVDDLIKDFGSFENWLIDFKAVAMSSRGWGVLGYDFNEGRLKNFLCDAHNLYGVWGSAPIIALDMYEHAYIIDFGSDRKSYIESFLKNLNWEVIDKKYQKCFK